MLTPIGRGFSGGRTRTLAGLVGAALVGADLLLCWRGDYDSLLRPVPALVAWLFFLLLTRGDTASVGLRLRPLQGWGYWVRVGLMLGAAVGLFAVAAYGVSKFIGRPLTIYQVAPSELCERFWTMCLYAPLVE